jgi:hypothetical protein
MYLGRSLGRSLGRTLGDNGLPPIPSGYVFLTDKNGIYLTDRDNNYLIAKE